MGILDDAIREHLDLKRRLGAAENELARLEGEAFGPPTRPGDPDFPDDTPADQTAAEPVTGEAMAARVAEPPPVVDPAPSEQAPEPAAEQAPAEPAPVPVPAPDPVPPPEPEPVSPPTAEHPAPTAESLAVEPTPMDDLELELELDLDEVELEDDSAEPPSEEAPAAPATDERAAVEPQPTPPEQPVESLDTVEHHFEGAIEDTGDVEVVEGELTDDEAPAEAGDDDEQAEEDEDVLEETPEFLRDQPEDDELWFEQGEPKDFDF